MFNSSKKKKLFVAVAIVVATASFTGTALGGIARQLSNEIADTIEKVMPSVVVVRTEAVHYYLARDYYRGNLYRIPQPLAGQGSGVIFDESGYILTSYHVVKDADNIEVALEDESKYNASLVGTDPNTDLAVLKIENDADRKFDPLPIGNSENLRVGEMVVAVGSPFSLQSSVTMGIVSQKGRQVGLLPYEDFIQTDASINPGNSGGPLVNLDGRMVGINAVIQTPNPGVQGNIGIGFAVPINLAIRVAQSIIEHGQFERPWIGIAPRDTGSQEADAKRDETGVIVGKVFRNSPAAEAGLQRDDVILKVNETTIENIAELQKAIILVEPKEEIQLTVRRANKSLKLDMTPQPIPTQNVIPRR